MPENEAVTKFVTAMTEILTSAKDFVIEQAPDVLRQWLAWGMVDALCGIALGVLFLVGAFVCWRLLQKTIAAGKLRPCEWSGLHDHDTRKPRPTRGECAYCDLSDQISGGGVVLSVACGALVLLGVAFVMDSSRDAIKIHFAPKVWLIEQFRHGVK